MQWTGIVTSIAIEMLESGRVDAVVCVQNDENDRFGPKPVCHQTLLSTLCECHYHPADITLPAFLSRKSHVPPHVNVGQQLGACH